MELIAMPQTIGAAPFKGWPEVYRVSKNEPLPPSGISYVIAEKTDFALLFRIMVPLLMKHHPYFDWFEIYQDLVGKKYYEQRVYHRRSLEDAIGTTGSSYGALVSGIETMTIADLACDRETYVDIETLTELAMLPAFMTDIRDAITINVTNNYKWTDGYNKKTGICSGYLTEQHRPRNLVVLDISSSIPDGVSAGMMTLIKTITSLADADLILTGGRSYFYTFEQAQAMDIHEERMRIPRSNESSMFREILATHDMDYDVVITFGDSDNPGPIDLGRRIKTQVWYSFFTMEVDVYGNSYHEGAGYGRWVKENNPDVTVVHNTDWARFFTKKEQRW